MARVRFPAKPLFLSSLFPFPIILLYFLLYFFLPYFLEWSCGAVETHSPPERKIVGSIPTGIVSFSPSLPHSYLVFSYHFSHFPFTILPYISVGFVVKWYNICFGCKWPGFDSRRSPFSSFSLLFSYFFLLLLRSLLLFSSSILVSFFTYFLGLL